jgi:uncharacterized protein (DUF1810 family)
MNDHSNLNRFINAQESGENIDFETALSEIKKGKKTNHWIWYVFPQLEGLVEKPSYNTLKFSIKTREEAFTYFHHPILGVRLKVICQALLELNNQNIESIVGYSDYKKIKSCMTLFDEVTDASVTIFKDILDKYYGGSKDEKTLSLINMD